MYRKDVLRGYLYSSMYSVNTLRFFGWEEQATWSSLM